ncbi:MAG: nuclear transport factor 2 family protein [Erythrobacter sp.]
MFNFLSRLAILAAASLALPGCAHSVAASASDELSIASAYVEAYNSRDLKEMSALMHDEVQWISIEGSEAAIFANGKADLIEQMRSYLTSPMATLSELDGSVTDGRFVAVREIARWSDAEGNPKSQSALAVYEIEEGLVRRVWYYPASR